MEHIGRKFDELGDEYFRQRKDDIMDVGKHVMRHLLGRQDAFSSAQLTERSIIIAHDLGPSDTLSMRDDLVEGIRHRHRRPDVAHGDFGAGAGNSRGCRIERYYHPGAVQAIWSSSMAMKALSSSIPTMAVLENYRKAREIQLAESRELEKLKDLPAQTKDGRRVALASNIETPGRN